MKDGHICRIATHSEFQTWIESFGIEFRALPGNPADLVDLCVRHGMFSYSLVREVRKRFKNWLEDLLDACFNAAHGTDVIVESPISYGGQHAAEKLGLAYFGAFHMVFSSTGTYPHAYLSTTRNYGQLYNRLTHLMTEAFFGWRPINRINTWRSKSLDLPPYELSTFSKPPYLYNFSEVIVPKPMDWCESIEICGYWFLENSDGDWKPPASLLEFLESGSKPVYIGFGSVVVADPYNITRMIVEAVKKAGVRAILCTGWLSRTSGESSKIIELPECIYEIDKVPHRWLFPKMAAVVHHGGCGTTAEGLRAGAPTLILPFTGDQYFWSERVKSAGCGSFLLKWDIDSLAAAIQNVTTDVDIAKAASKIGFQIRSENGVEKAANRIYSDYHSAKKRILDMAKYHKNRKMFLFCLFP